MAAATLALVVAVQSQASAVDRYDGVAITNRTGVTVTYSVRWGDGPWQTGSVRPGGVITHYWSYKKPNVRDSPRLQIRFDADLSGGTYIRTHSLRKYPSSNTNPRNFRRYAFRRESGQQRFISL